MLEDEVLSMLVRGTRGGSKTVRRSNSKSVRKTGSKTTKRKTTKRKAGSKGVAKSGYIAHVKKYWKAHPNLTWKEAMVKARTTYKPKSKSGSKSVKRGSKSVKRGRGTRAGAMAGAMAGASFREKASKVNKTLRDKKAISKTLRALSAIPTPLSGYAQDAALVAQALGYGRRRC